MKGFYLIGNYPDETTFVEAIRIAENYGFDFIEVGIPFSDPVADGPFLASRAKIAIDRGINIDLIIKTLKEHKFNIDLYIMTYSNIILAKDPKNLDRTFRNLGIKGLIIADLPNRMHGFFREMGITLPIVNFATPESPYEELERLKSIKEGFIYFVSVRGITGTNLNLDKETLDKISYLKGKTCIPVVLGFGVKSRREVEIAIKIADGYVIGTEAVRKLEEGIRSFESFVMDLVDFQREK